MSKKSRTPKFIEREFIHLEERVNRVPRGHKRTALVAKNRCKTLAFNMSISSEEMARLIAANMPSFSGHVRKDRVAMLKSEASGSRMTVAYHSIASGFNVWLAYPTKTNKIYLFEKGEDNIFSDASSDTDDIADVGENVIEENEEENEEENDELELGSESGSDDLNITYSVHSCEQVCQHNSNTVNRIKCTNSQPTTDLTAMSQQNIVFLDASGFPWPYETSEKDTTDKNFVKVQVKSGTWILYKLKDYNEKSSTSTTYKVVKQGDTVDLTNVFSPGSFWKATDDENSVVLFEHWYYGGKRKQYKKGCPDITGDFPPDTKAGVSSFIIWPQKEWEMYLQREYLGTPKVYSPMWCENVNNHGFPDNQMQSLKPKP